MTFGNHLYMSIHLYEEAPKDLHEEDLISLLTDKAPIRCLLVSHQVFYLHSIWVGRYYHCVFIHSRQRDTFVDCVQPYAYTVCSYIVSILNKNNGDNAENSCGLPMRN